MKKVPYLKCIKCNKKINRLDDSTPQGLLEADMWEDGIVGALYGSYGSIHDKKKFIIAICDDCVNNNKSKLVCYEKIFLI